MNKKEIKRKRSLLEAQKVVRILEKGIAKIRYVQDWAFLFGRSKTKLNQLMKDVFDKSAKAVMKEICF